MTGTKAPSRVSSVSEIQAALRAGQAGQFADSSATPAAAPNLPPPMPPPVPPARGGSGVWLLGTHGGSGARCLSAVLPDTRCTGRAWPISWSSRREPVVLVCRANHRGLTAAQDYARAYRDDGLAERLQLLGVIVSADAPGRMPTPLRRLERLLSGAVPILGHAPWEATWRLGPPVVTGEPLPWLAKLGQSLRAAVEVAS